MPLIQKDLTNSVYLPRGQAGRNQEHLLRQINLVGLNHATKLAGGAGIRGMLCDPGPLTQIMAQPRACSSRICATQAPYACNRLLPNCRSCPLSGL